MEDRANILHEMKICRFCLSSDEKELSNIYEPHAIKRQREMKHSVPLPLQIMACIAIEVFEHDGMPQLICNPCRSRTVQAYTFKTNCKRADDALKVFLHTGQLTKPPMEPFDNNSVQQASSMTQKNKKIGKDNAAASTNATNVHEPKSKRIKIEDGTEIITLNFEHSNDGESSVQEGENEDESILGLEEKSMRNDQEEHDEYDDEDEESHVRRNKMAVYTVWNHTRVKKVMIVIDSTGPDPYASLIFKASTKMGIIGRKLVLESNGTEVDEDALDYVNNEILILLEKNQHWTNPDTLPPIHNVISTDIVTSTGCVTPIDNEVSSRTLILAPTPSVVPQQNDEDLFCKETVISYPVSEIICNITTREGFWQEFVVPFTKMSNEELAEMTKKKLNNRIRKKLIHLTVDEMRTYTKNIPTKAFRVVAKQIVYKYPEPFKEYDDDLVLLGDGTHSLFTQLQEHNNYLNRPHKRGRAGSVSKERKKKASAGGSQLPSGACDTLTSLLNVKETDANFVELLEQNYDELRRFLNQPAPPSIRQIRDDYPVLFARRCVVWHFNKLTGSNVEIGLGRIGEKAENIIANTGMEFGSELSMEIRVLKCLAMHFKESIDELYVEVKELNGEVKDKLPVTPCILNVGSPEDTPSFFVFVERENIDTKGYDSFNTALQVAFSLYYILNLQYCKSCETTLEFIQRYFLKIHPDQGNKTRKVSSSRNKVFKFMRKLNKGE